MHHIDQIAITNFLEIITLAKVKFLPKIFLHTRGRLTLNRRASCSRDISICKIKTFLATETVLTIAFTFFATSTEIHISGGLSSSRKVLLVYSYKDDTSNTQEWLKQFVLLIDPFDLKIMNEAKHYNNIHFSTLILFS